ncbi:MAG: hypothetical protein C4334_10030 [Pyrinomonas sp.]|uniref:DUF427 domain-containing protein n=1 Tax=Pyrinomonas sp. TaxID=2080306 RepID=UPI0033234DFF
MTDQKFESVWDYPRPPRVERSAKHVRVVFNGVVIADTRRAERVLETSHPPVYYIPREDVCMEFLTQSGRRSHCEWKGEATYYHVSVGERRAENGAWSYLDPRPEYRAIRGHIAFYASKMDACYVDDERVQPQPGDFYGGWITREIRGPFKGERGTEGW